MQKRIKQFLSIILTAAMILTMNTSVFAASSTTSTKSGKEDSVTVGATSSDIIMVKGQKTNFGVGVWTTSNKTIATVNKNSGAVVAKKAGTATISSTGKVVKKKGKEISYNAATYNITVLEPSISDKKLTLVVGDSTTLSLNNAPGLSVAWDTSNASVVYAADGYVQAIGTGSAKVTAYANGMAYSCNVKVQQNPTVAKQDMTDAQLNVAQTFNYKTSDKTFKANKADWKSSDEKVATVVKGKITGINVGTAVITGVFNGVTKTINITVKAIPQATDIYLNVSKTKAIKLFGVKANKATWSSADNSIATVAGGKVTGVAKGTTAITCVYNDVTYKVQAHVEETGLVTDSSSATTGSLQSAGKTNKYTLTLDKGQKYAISTVYTKQALIWKSSKPKVAAVDEFGIIDGLNTGVANVSTKINGTAISIAVTVTSNEQPATHVHDYSYKTIVLVEATTEHEGKIMHQCKCGDYTIETTPRLAKTFTITFDANGGKLENASDATRKISENGVYGKLPVATRDTVNNVVYAFAGWYNGDTQVSSDTIATSDATVKAKWSESKYCVVTFDAEGGVITSGDTTKTLAVNQTIGDLPEATRPADQDGTTYTFGGWYINGAVATEDTVIINSTTVKAKWIAQYHYTVTFNANGGTVVGVGSKYVSGNDAIGELPTATKISPDVTKILTFASWNTSVDGKGTTWTADTKVVENITLYAQYTESPAKQYAYNVYYMQQKLGASDEENDTNYDKVDTASGNIYAGQVVPADVKIYDGFVSPAKQTVIVSGDTVITYYYKRSAYKLDVTAGTGVTSVTGAGSYSYGQSVTISGDLAAGYSGYQYQSTNKSVAGATFTMPAENVAVTILGIPDGGVKYEVKHMLQDLDNNYTIVGNDSVYYGKTGDTVTPERNTYEGFTAPTQAQSIAIAGDGSTVVTYQYTRNSYNLTINAGDNIDSVSDYTSTKSVKYGQQIDVTVTASKGYKVGALTGSGSNNVQYSFGTSFTMPADNLNLTANALASDSTTYTVKCMLEDLEGNNYIEDTTHTQVLTGKTGSSVNVDPIDISGYNKPSSTSVTIAADGSSVVTFNYSRKSYTLTLVASKGITAVNGGGSYKYGKTVYISATPSAGYDFTSWDGGIVNAGTSFTMIGNDVTLTAVATSKTYSITYNLDGGVNASSNPATYTVVSSDIAIATPTKTGYSFHGWKTSEGNVVETPVIKQGSTGNLTFTAVFSANTDTQYTVEHYQHILGSAEYTLAMTETLRGTTGIEVTPSTQTYAGFTSPALQTATIKGDNSTVIKYYYERNEYSVTVASGTGVSNARVLSADPAATDSKYKYGTTITLSADVARGYEDLTWSGDSTSSSFQVSANDMNVTASAKAHVYSIIYSLSSDGVNNAVNPSTYTVASGNIAFGVPTRPAYKFLGWTVTVNGEQIYNDAADDSTEAYTLDTSKYLGDVVMTANWKLDTFVITFNGNGGTTSDGKTTKDSTYTFGVVGNAIANPFTTAPTFTVTYDLNGGTLSDTTGLTTTDSGKTYTGTYNKVFSGWNTKSDGTGKTVSANGAIEMDSVDALNNLFGN